MNRGKNGNRRGFRFLCLLSFQSAVDRHFAWEFWWNGSARFIGCIVDLTVIDTFFCLFSGFFFRQRFSKIFRLLMENNIHILRFVKISNEVSSLALLVVEQKVFWSFVWEHEQQNDCLDAYSNQRKSENVVPDLLLSFSTESN